MTQSGQIGGPPWWGTRLAQIVKVLVLVSGLALLGGMVWQVGRAGLRTKLPRVHLARQRCVKVIYDVSSLPILGKGEQLPRVI